MKRRDFIRTTMALTAFGARIPLMAIGKNGIQSSRRASWETDHIAVLIKLNGGNDGLNTIIPTQDSNYYNLRPNLALTESQTLYVNEETSLHPSMAPIHPLVQEGQMGIIHGVGYENGNLSHFRSSDIWVTGSSADTHLQTGWIGRLLELEYPDFPGNTPNHPLAIQYNSANLLEFKTSESNAGMMVFDPEIMYNIIAGNYVPGEDDPAPDTYGGEELDYIREIDILSYEYAGTISETASQGTNTVEYPNSNIGYQMALTAQMISGGLNTPLYRLYQGGYDTHANQLNDHSNLLGEVSQSITSFLQDLSNQGLSERVLVITTSEFGRRVYENGSAGTDHGTSAPCMIFGPNVTPEIFGQHLDLTDLDNNNNPRIQYDYRQIYSSVITDWFGLQQEISDTVFGSTFDPIPYVLEPLSVKQPPVPTKFKLNPAFPNPFNPTTMLSYTLPRPSNVTIRLFDSRGSEIQTHRLGRQNPGRNTFRIDGRNLASGSYFAQIESGGTTLSQKITLLK